MITRTSRALQEGADSAQTLNSQLLDTAEHAIHATRDIAGSAISKASEAAARAQKELGRYAYATRGYVAEKPVQSALIALAAGAAVAAVVMAVRRQRNR